MLVVEVVVDQRGVDPGVGGDAADRRPGETLVGEGVAGRGQDLPTGVGIPGPPAGFRGRGRHIAKSDSRIGVLR